jgi:predicted dehydrogenase
MRDLTIGLCGEGAAATRLAERVERIRQPLGWRDACLPTRLPDVDACLIACPVVDRVPTARVLVRVGTPVLMAWPPAGSVGELRRLVREAEESGVAAAASLPLRFHPDLAELPSAPRLVTIDHTGVGGPVTLSTLATLADLALQLGRGYRPRRLVATLVRTPTHAARAASFSVRFDNGMLIHATAFAAGTPAMRIRAVSSTAESATDLFAGGGLAYAENAELRAFLRAAAERRPLRPGLNAGLDALRLAALIRKRAR